MRERYPELGRWEEMTPENWRILYTATIHQALADCGASAHADASLQWIESDAFEEMCAATGLPTEALGAWARRQREHSLTSKRRFCKNGHDTHLCGRRYGECKACRRMRKTAAKGAKSPRGPSPGGAHPTPAPDMWN